MKNLTKLVVLALVVAHLTGCTALKVAFKGPQAVLDERAAEREAQRR